MNLFHTVWHWVEGQILQEVPSEHALCEFDCRKPQCFQGEWENCMRRIRRAAGELMPLRPPDATLRGLEANSIKPYGRESYLPHGSVHGEC